MWYNESYVTLSLYLGERIWSDHASASLIGHPICWPQREWSLPNLCRDWVDDSGLYGTSVGSGERLVEAHHRRARSGHDLVVGVLIGHGRLRGGQNGIGQVRTTGVSVRLLPAQLPSIVHGMLPVEKTKQNGPESGYPQ